MRNRRAEQRSDQGEKQSSPSGRERVGSVPDRRGPLVGSCYGSGAESGEQADDERVGYGGGAGEEERALGTARDEPTEHQQGNEREQRERGRRKTE